MRRETGRRPRDNLTAWATFSPPSAYELQMYNVLDLADYVQGRPEALGTKEKFWLTPRPGVLLNNRPHLFKIGRENTGENWSEKVSCEIAKLLGLPCANYELATYEGRRGVLTEKFFASTGTWFPGNYLLSRALTSYDNTKTYSQLDYKLSTVFHIIRRFKPRPPVAINVCAYGMDGLDYFIGYLVFDCLIGNTDRHHENWGVILNNSEGHVDLHLAPTFDHASSLGRNELDQKRVLRLTTTDKRATVEAYAERTKSAFYGMHPQNGVLKTSELMAELAAAFPKVTKLWSDRIATLTDGQFNDILNSVPPDWVSQPAAEFAMRMLQRNRHMIREAGCA